MKKRRMIRLLRKSRMEEGIYRAGRNGVTSWIKNERNKRKKSVENLESGDPKDDWFKEVDKTIDEYWRQHGSFCEHVTMVFMLGLVLCKCEKMTVEERVDLIEAAIAHVPESQKHERWLYEEVLHKIKFGVLHYELEEED